MTRVAHLAPQAPGAGGARHQGAAGRAAAQEPSTHLVCVCGGGGCSRTRINDFGGYGDGGERKDGGAGDSGEKIQLLSGW